MFENIVAFFKDTTLCGVFFCITSGGRPQYLVYSKISELLQKCIECQPPATAKNLENTDFF